MLVHALVWGQVRGATCGSRAALARVAELKGYLIQLTNAWPLTLLDPGCYCLHLCPVCLALERCHWRRAAPTCSAQAALLQLPHRHVPRSKSAAYPSPGASAAAVWLSRPSAEAIQLCCRFQCWLQALKAYCRIKSGVLTQQGRLNLPKCGSSASPSVLAGGPPRSVLCCSNLETSTVSALPCSEA